MSNCYVCGEDLLQLVKPYRPVQVIGCHRCLNVSQLNWVDDLPVAQPVPSFETLGNLAPRGTVMSGILEVVPKSISDLPVLAEIPQRVVSTIHDPISAISDVVGIIEEDVVLSTKILSLANSAYFATPNEINDLNTACSRLGMRALANIANSMASAHQYRSTDPIVRKLMQSLWQHAIVTAHCTEALALKLNIHTPNSFIAGLLHDIGKLVMVDAIMNHYKGSSGRLKEVPAIMAKAINPFSPLVGLHVVQHWKLSPDLFFATLFSQKPELVPHDTHRAEIHCVRLGSDIAELKGYGIGNPDDFSMENHPVLEYLDLSQEDLDEFVLGLDEMLDSVLGVLGSLE